LLRQNDTGQADNSALADPMWRKNPFQKPFVKKRKTSNRKECFHEKDYQKTEVEGK